MRDAWPSVRINATSIPGLRSRVSGDADWGRQRNPCSGKTFLSAHHAAPVTRCRMHGERQPRGLHRLQQRMEVQDPPVELRMLQKRSSSAENEQAPS
ncbi:hypothetical protein NQZ68_022218 [Dissostichus eleginoides]|nr:hypothetical protein NQZ68_022218 [Dissostichus eleginoides]